MSAVPRTSTTASASRAGFSQIKVPIGEMLTKTIHDSYGTLLEMILELVQNGVDADARFISVTVNKKTRAITVTDDGDGVSKEKYELALQSVMRSKKTRDKYGQFGMGMLSPLAKCEWHELISCPRGGTTYLQWVFKTDEIKAQNDEVFIPHRPRQDLRFADDPRGFKGATKVGWRTMVVVHGFTTDKLVGRLPDAQSLFHEVTRKYREKMLERKIELSITIISEKDERTNKTGFAKPYSGRRLGEVVIANQDAGETHFHLYLARKSEKKYEGDGVSVGEADNAFRFSFRTFARSPAAAAIKAEVVEALCSGVFEGDILTERAKLHSDRKSFEPSDALLGFCMAIEDWYTQHGKQHYEAALELRDGERYKALGDELSKFAEGFVKDPRFKDLLKPFATNLLSAPVADPSGRDTAPVGDKRDGGKGVSGGGSGPGDGSGSGQSAGGGVKSGSSSAEVPDERDKRRPRAKVRSQSLGIEFRYEDIYDERKLYEYEPGVLTFNVLHPQWRACERPVRRQKQLQEFIFIKAMILHTLPEEWREHADAFTIELMGPFVYLLQSSPNFQHLGKQAKKNEG